MLTHFINHSKPLFSARNYFGMITSTKMTKKRYEIKELSKIHDIIKSSQSVRIAFPPDEDGYPYILPFTFGFENNTFYFHSNKKGRKLDFFKEQPKVKVGFQLDTDLKLVLGKRSCDCDIKYRSVVGAGIAELVEDPDEVKFGLQQIMKQYHPDPNKIHTFDTKFFPHTQIWKVTVVHLKGKSNIKNI